MKPAILAADLGGTNLRMAAVDHDGTIIYRARRATPHERSRGSIVGLISEVANECRAAILPSYQLVSFGFAVPAVVDGSTGKILSAPNLPELDGFDVAKVLSEGLSLPVIVENDANAAAIGEHWKGASRDARSVINVTLGTGVGGGIILNNACLRGIDGTAGEIGHICVEPFGVPCGCGSTGCLEQYASASAIVRMASALLNEYPESVLADEDELTALVVYEAGKAGDRLSIEVFRRMGFYLGIGLAGLINVLNPEVIVIGGGASNGWDLFAEPMTDEIRKRAFQRPAERVKLVRAALGDDAGILGVAQLATRTDFEASSIIAL